MGVLVATLTAAHVTLLAFFGATQVLYLVSLLTVGYFYTRSVDEVLDRDVEELDATDHLPVLLLYPVLHELEETMETTFLAIDHIDYPRDSYRVVAIPNHDDAETIAALRRLQRQFDWLEVLPVPSVADPTWSSVWESWEANDHAYWWHKGKRAGVRDLPPKKTRQLIYAFYSLCPPDGPQTLISYIDADSAPPPNYFRLGAAGAKAYDVVQLTNVAGNLLSTWATSFHAFDHICWDASLYGHMTAGGKHPYYVLGKGLFFKSTDLHAFGGFHPWLTIEDPEVGMRLWTNGRRLGVVPQPLVEEVPSTFRQGITQRKRWVCGFLQSAASPLRHMGMTRAQRLRARLNLVPCMSLLLNPVGLVVGLWILALAIMGSRPVDLPLEVLAVVNIIGLVGVLAHNWHTAWRVSALVCDTRSARRRYALRVNPVFVLGYWLFWTISLAIGLRMFLRDQGLVWERTEKIDANHTLVRTLELGQAGIIADPAIDLRPAAQVIDIRSKPDDVPTASEPTGT